MARENPATQPGQSATELAIILALVVIVAIGGLTVAGESTRDALCRAASAFGDVCGLILSEDFSDISDWVASGGNWQNRDGQLCVNGVGRIYRPLDRSDYTINVDVARLSRGPGYGVFFRDSGGAKFNGYSFQYDQGYGRGEFIIRKWVNGNELSAPIGRASAPAGYSWYNTDRQVRVEVVGDTFTAYVDGQQVVQARDSSFTSGGVGFRSWYGGSSCFDNMSIARP